MDVFTLLRRDHERLRALCANILSQVGQADPAERQAGFRELRAELELHAQVEDLHVYRVFQQAEPTREAAARALEAHRQIKALLDRLGALAPGDWHWVTTFRELHQAVEQHIAEEEQEMFAQAPRVLTSGEAEELGAAVEVAKQEVRGEVPPPAGGLPR